MIGMDIGCEFNAMCLMNKDGEVLNKYLRIYNALKAVLDDYFPELKGIFWSMKSKGLWAVLAKCPFPEDVMRLGIERLTEIISKSTRRKAGATQKATKVYKAAPESIGLKQVGTADRFKVKMYLEEIKRSEAQLKELLREVPFARYISSISGIGVLSWAVWLGDRVIHRNKYFKDYYQTKLASNNSFGQPLKKKEALCAV